MLSFAHCLSGVLLSDVLGAESFVLALGAFTPSGLLCSCGRHTERLCSGFLNGE